MSTDGLVEFVEARLSDDEQAARDAMVSMSDSGEWRAHHTRGLSTVKERGYYLVAGEMAAETAEHIARHDPARVLRGVEAKRRILAMWPGDVRLPAGAADGRDPDERERDDAVAGALYDVLRELASAWSGHPDYHAEWAS